MTLGYAPRCQYHGDAAEDPVGDTEKGREDDGPELSPDERRVPGSGAHDEQGHDQDPREGPQHQLATRPVVVDRGQDLHSAQSDGISICDLFDKELSYLSNISPSTLNNSIDQL